MPIEGRTIGEASRSFKDHLNRLLSHTITQTPLVIFIEPRTGLAEISFRQGGFPSAARLQTKFGPMDFYLGQMCDAIDGERDQVHLRTLKYQYTLKSPDASEPALRWEYDKFPSGDALWCRHHVQGPVSMDFGSGHSIVLNDMHLPTGWVTIEEVIRFCLVDLAVPSLDKSYDADGVPSWHTRLKESYELFKTQFATLGDM